MRGWSNTQILRRICGRRGGAAAASDDDDSPALQVYSSTGLIGQCTDASSSGGSSTDAEASAAVAPEDDASVATIQLDMPRRSMQVTFTCDKCGTRTSRTVNPLAWDKGLVLAQCSGCNVWHKLKDAAGLVDEIRYTDEDGSSNSD